MLAFASFPLEVSEMDRYVDLLISALAAGIGSGVAVYQTLSDPTHYAPAVVAGLSAMSVAAIQHLRQLPRKEWTDEERAAKAPPQETK